MSADNYYEINTERREDGTFRFGVNMGFASDENEDPLYNTGRTTWFDDLNAAIAEVADSYAEYGWSIVENEDWLAYQRQQAAKVDAQTLAREAELRAEGAAAERERIAKLLALLAEFRTEYGSKEDLNSDSHSIRQMALSISISIDTMRIAAHVVEKNHIEEVQGYLPSWRWNDERLQQLGLEV